jgi:basic membrane lipoprotein Med (substrate-binding protein (PBP1-ABC) superfamily)
MRNTRKAFFFFFIAVLVLGAVPAALAQDRAPIERVCLVTDLGRVNDGTFNEFAYNGMVSVAEDYDLDTTFIETQSETDYDANIATCVEEGYEAIITVGFLIQDATVNAAIANPDIFFIGIDQDATAVADGAPANFVGVQFREDQAGFLVGVLAALVAEDMGADTIAGVYGVDVPAVKRFRNGYEQGARYINPDLNILGKYEASFIDPAAGASTARQFIGEGAVVIFGAGGPTGSGAIAEAAKQGVYVIGVDQDEYLTTFGAGETEGAEFIISSAQKRVDQGVYDMVAALAEGDFEAFPGGQNYLLDAELEGVGFAPKHDADVSDEIYAQVEEILALLVAGEIETGVDPVSGDLLSEVEPVATEAAG